MSGVEKRPSRQAHNLKIAGSTPAPAITPSQDIVPPYYRAEAYEDDLERRDRELILRVVAEWRSGQWDQIQLKCFNETEADMLKRRIHQIDPSVNLACSWFVWPSL